MDGVTLRFLPGSKALSVLAANGRLVPDVIGDIVEVDRTPVIARLGEERGDVRPIHEAVIRVARRDIRRDHGHGQAFGIGDPRTESTKP